MHLLNSLFHAYNLQICLGGNIGIPLFSLLKEQHTNFDYGLIETSSFQLQQSKTFIPHLAIWTNFYPNHLDYHSSEEEYFLAKYSMFSRQTSSTLSLIPFCLKDKIPPTTAHHKRAFFMKKAPTVQQCNSLSSHEYLYFLTKNNHIKRYNNNQTNTIIKLKEPLSTLSFIDNILIMIATGDILQLNMQNFNNLTLNIQLPEHRLEKVATYQSIDFYNDSKSTTIASTLAAIEKINNSSLHLFIGGLSKGVDKTAFIKQLKLRVKRIYCFGKEADMLYNLCLKSNIASQKFYTLDDAFNYCMTYAQSGDVVLFSPAGSSYDLYKDYQERGNHFKECVYKQIQKCT